MTVDALVNLFIQRDKTTESPQNNTESQREQHFTASSPHPIPNVSVPFHQSPTTALPAAGDSIEKPTRKLETEFQAADVPVVDRCVDLDVFSPPPPSPVAVDADCAFCGTAGTPHTCGALVAVKLGDKSAAVHHACALWAPQVYQPQDCEEYLNLESEWRHSQNRRCLVCNGYGAAVTCTYAGCRAAYHLPCAALAKNVTLDKASFELWCPKHASIHDNTNSEEEEYGSGRGRARQYNRRASGLADEFDEEFSPSQSGARPRRNAALSRKHRFQRTLVDGATSSGGSAARDRAAVVAATAAAAVAVSDRTQRPRTDWQRQGDAWVKVVPPWWCEHRTIHFANKVFRELFCGHTSAFLVDADGTEWDCLVSIETRNDMRLQYTLRGQFQEYWDAAGVKSGDVLTFQRNTPTSGKIKVGRYPQGRGLESALDTAGNCYSNATTTTGSKESTIAAATSKIAAPLPLSNLGPREPKTTSGSQRIRQQQQQRRQDGAAVADAGGASGHPNRWTELPDGSAAKTVYKSTLAHQQCPVAGWLYRKLYGRTPADVDTAPMRDPALATDFLFEVAFVPAANVHYISGRAFSGWMKAAGLQSGDQIRVWRDQSGVKICRMANNNPSRLAGGGLVGEGLSEDGNALSLETFTSPPGVEALAALNALAAAAGYAGQHGTPAIDAVLSHAADLRNLVTSGQQEVNTLLSIGDALKMRLAEAGMPTPPSPFLMSAAGGMEKKRKNENLGASDTIVKQPRLNSNVHVPPSAPTAPIPVVPPPAAAAAGGTVVAQPPPSQIQLQQALQHLIRHYQMHQQQQQQQQPFPATARPAAPVLFHRATPATALPPPPSQPNAPAKQQPSMPSMHSNNAVWSTAAPNLKPKQQQPEETREEEQHEAVEKQN